jgi:translation initiation factor 3 subunit I
MYEEEMGTVSGHFSPINCLVYFPDGNGFATAAEEGNIKVIKFDDRYWEFE